MRFSVAILITIIACKCKTSELDYEKETDNIQENNETIQTDNNCTPILSNLKINGSSEELNITWDGNASELCNFQYRIKILFQQTNRNIFSDKINTTYYLFKNIKPCTKYKIIVDLLQSESATPLQSLTEKYETDSIAFNQIEKLNISTTTSAIWLSWKAHKYAHVCNIRYIITANKEIPYFRYVNRTEHWIKNLHSCTEYNVSVTPSSRLRSKFDENTPYLMHTISTLPEQVDNLSLEVDNNNSNITWIAPDYNECINEYKITINRTVSETTKNTYLYRSENLYCTEIEIEPVDNNNASGAVARILKPGPIQNLRIIATETSITATWEEPENSQCVTNYTVMLISVESDINETINTTSLTHTFDNLKPCSQFDIKVAARSSDNILGEFTSDRDSTSEPKELGPVRKLIIAATETSITATWEQPEHSQCVANYVVELISIGSDINETINTTFLTHTFDNLKPCSQFDIKVAARSANNILGEFTSDRDSTSEPKELGPVQKLIIAATETSITATWEQPEHSQCVANYAVELISIGSDVNETINTTSLTYTFDNLKPCSQFNIKVAARSSSDMLGEYTTALDSTSEPNDLSNVSVNFLITDKLVTWDHPSYTKACNLTYLLNVYDSESKEVYNDSTTNNFIVIGYDLWIGCMDYTVSITPTLDLTIGYTVEGRVNFPSVTNQPICVEKGVNETSAVLECTLDSYETNMCIIKTIFISCEASADHNNGSWVIWNKNTSQNIEDNFERNPVNVTVTNISEFTNYTCYGIVANSAGNSSNSELVPVHTKEGVPDAPELIEITEPINRTLYIKWTEPQKIPGVLQYYTVNITSNGPQYFTPNNDCMRKEEPIYEYQVEPSVNHHYFSEGFPKYQYTIHIRASTRVGYGPESNAKSHITNPGIPEEPRNIDYHINNTTTIKNYNANVTLTWMYPCYTNGLIENFKIDVLGYPYADLDNKNDTRNGTIIPINENILNFNYTHIITDLLPAYNYIVNITTVIEDNLEGKRDIPFLSPESYPEAPMFKPITEVNNNSFTLEWNTPAQKNGHILNYDLLITTQDFLYWIPEECPKINKSYPFKISPNVRSFTFTKARPYHKYSAYINASTSIGQGPNSEMLLTETLPIDPEPVRDFVANPTNSTAEEYNAQLLLSFKYPCNVYGSFKQFTVMLHGNRSNNSHEEIKIERDNKTKYEFNFDLRAEYNYAVIVQVETESHNTSTELAFTSLSGVPPITTKDIEVPIPHDSTQANFTFNCDLFDDIYGEIQYYALILGENNHEEKSLYGFWNGTNDTWPLVGNTFAEETQIQPYQATPIGWNPFLNASCYNYTFVLGDESTEFNKPLQDGVMYTLKVRGFTKLGYRDSPTIIFLMPALTNLALILGLVFGLLGTAILLGFIYILWRKRKQWEMKKESIKSIPLTPLPVSIKQFSQYYDELRTNSDRLKEEFALLANKSKELIQSTDDGLTPENKKKNRYTNIIPYDETRVKLMDTNDNYTITDYINASYIIGYSGTMEYIATQGPLEHTCMDFWKMVIQENSSLIVMVAQFVEQNKDKCYKYFPNNHENMELENGIAIRCCTELDFKTHIVRTLLIQKDLQQWTVTHLQFTNWPDFGCPTGTDVILEFCQIMREHAERNSDPIIIHCSAGVGRTGTLIALDIVLQAISYKRDIDIFGTVLNLRRDRKNMVQTEKQYLYIHNCIKDSIENPPPIQCDISKEPVYENLEDIKSSQSDNNIKESIF